MAIPSSGPISLQTIQDEFGGSHPISLSEYYGSDTVPTSGAISISNFYGTSSVTPVTVTITSNTNNYTLQPSAIPGYVSGSTAVTLVINSGVVIGSTSTGSTALTISGFASGDTVSVTNNGYIVGKGGNGGSGQQSGIFSGTYYPPQSGGLALSTNFAVSMTNNGTVGGGGGGGGGGSFHSYTSGKNTYYHGGNGGGGGAGRNAGSGGTRGNYGSGLTNYPGVAGSGGSLTGGGAAGSCGHSSGASGGSLGASGGSSTYGGGSGGACTSGNSYITWVTTGTRAGALN
jgi:hypothetical protein